VCAAQLDWHDALRTTSSESNSRTNNPLRGALLGPLAPDQEVDLVLGAEVS
jgi:hypothetical protein